MKVGTATDVVIVVQSDSLLFAAFVDETIIDDIVARATAEAGLVAGPNVVDDHDLAGLMLVLESSSCDVVDGTDDDASLVLVDETFCDLAWCSM